MADFEPTFSTPSVEKKNDDNLSTVVLERPATRFWLGVGSLWFREIRGFYRQRARVVGSLVTPAIFWLLLSSGFAHSFRPNTEIGALEFFFPGMLTMVVLFTAIFSNISVIEDRREGFLLSVLAAPISRSVLVLGKVLGATTIGLLQGVVFLAIAPVVGLSFDPAKLPVMIAVIAGMSFSLTGLGFFFAWWLDSIQGFHTIMNVVLMPLWVLSGAVFPTTGAAKWMQWIMNANPLGYGVTALRTLFSDTGTSNDPSVLLCFIVLTFFSVLVLGATFYQVSRPSVRYFN